MAPSTTDADTATTPAPAMAAPPAPSSGLAAAVAAAVAADSSAARLDNFERACQLYRHSALWNPQSTTPWLWLDEQVGEVTLYAIDDAIAAHIRHVHGSRLDGKAKRKKPAHPRAPGSDCVSRIRHLGSSTHWRLRPRDILRDLDREACTNANFLRALASNLAYSLVDAQGRGIPWPTALGACKAASEKRRAGLGHDKGKQYTSADTAVAMDVLLTNANLAFFRANKQDQEDSRMDSDADTGVGSGDEIQVRKRARRQSDQLPHSVQTEREGTGGHGDEKYEPELDVGRLPVTPLTDMSDRLLPPHSVGSGTDSSVAEHRHGSHEHFDNIDPLLGPWNRGNAMKGHRYHDPDQHQEVPAQLQGAKPPAEAGTSTPISGTPAHIVTTRSASARLSATVFTPVSNRTQSATTPAGIARPSTAGTTPTHRIGAHVGRLMPESQAPPAAISTPPSIEHVALSDVAALLCVTSRPIPVMATTEGILDSLQPGRWLSASAVTALITCFNPDPATYRVFESGYLNLDDMDSCENRGRDSLSTQDVRIFPVCSNGNHFVLGIVDRIDHTIEVFDPLGHDPNEAREAVTRYAKGLSDTSWTRVPPPSLRQQNTYDCGVFVAVRAIMRMHLRECPPSLISEVWRRALTFHLSEGPSHDGAAEHPLVHKLEQTLSATATTHPLQSASEHFKFGQCLSQLAAETRTILAMYTARFTAARAQVMIEWYEKTKQDLPLTLPKGFRNTRIAEADRAISEQQKYIIQTHKDRDDSVRHALKTDIEVYTHLSESAKQRAMASVDRQVDAARQVVQMGGMIREAMSAAS